MSRANAGTKRRRGLFGGSSFSPRGLLIDAALITVLFLAAHLAGLREYTTVFSGTSPTGDVRDVVALAFGIGYVVFYLGFVVFVPVLILGAGIFLALEMRLGALASRTAAQQSPRRS